MCTTSHSSLFLVWHPQDPCARPHPPFPISFLVVVQDGRIVAERYREGWGPTTPQLSWSMGKSLTATLIGVLVHQGELAVEEPAPVPEWSAPGDPRGDIRIADLLHMSSGLDFRNLGLGREESLTRLNDHFYIYFEAPHVFRHAVTRLLEHEPGTVWRYRNSDPLTLGYLVRRAAQSRGERYHEFAWRHLFDRIGMRNVILETDAWGNYILTGYDYASARDWARLGLLHLNEGTWEGERILPAEWADFVSTPAPASPDGGYGGLWWLNRGGAYPSVPADAYWAAGFMGQTTMVIPSRDLVVVRLGPSAGRFNPYFDEVMRRVLEAVR
jgi:CubicO group peptidase (beta-lactamase class C family)